MVPQHSEETRPTASLRTVEEYVASLNDQRRVIFRGQLVGDLATHPHLSMGVRQTSLDFRLAEQSVHRDLLVTADREHGQLMSRYFVIPRGPEDLLLRRRLIETVTREGGGFPPLVKEIGTDALFALHIVASRMDRELGTAYLRRVRDYYSLARDGDFAMAVAQTDVKGDRGKRPAEQPYPDQYVRVVERNSNGILVRGAKAHTTNAVFANEIIVLPTRAMTERDKDYAVAFAVPANAEGVTMIASARGFRATSRFDNPISSRFNMTESLTIFDNVFVPWDRVFMCGEWRAAGTLAKTFVDFHRFTAISYKPPLLECLLGAAALIADYHGVAKAPHVRDKLAWLIMYLETVRGLSKAAAYECKVMEGVAVPDTILTNAAKFYFAHGYHTAVRAVQDLAGGLVVTGPSEEDWQASEVRTMMEPFLGGRAGVAPEHRLRAINLIRDLTASDLSGYLEVLAIHAEGSLEAQKMAVLADYDLEQYMHMAMSLAGIDQEATV